MKVERCESEGRIIYFVRSWKEFVVEIPQRKNGSVTTLRFDFDCKCGHTITTPQYRGKGYNGTCSRCGADISVNYNAVKDDFIVPVVVVR